MIDGKLFFGPVLSCTSDDSWPNTLIIFPAFFFQLALLISLLGCSGGGGIVASGPFNANRPAKARNFQELYRSEREVDSVIPTKPQEWSLPNGLQVAFRHDDELPLVSGTLYIRGGSLWESEDQIGISTALGDQMRAGGAGNYSADQLDRKLELMSASISSSFGAEFGKISFSCLDADFPEVIKLLADVVQRPRFDQRRLDVWRGLTLESIRRRKDDPETIASVAFQQLLYGASPYGRVLVSSDIERITRRALFDAHRRFVRSSGSVLAIDGSIDRAVVEKHVFEQFGAWDGAPAGEDFTQVPQISFEPKPGIYFVGGPFTQSTVYLGHLGVPRLTADYLEIDLFNQIFGTSSFGSRLMKRIRSDLGLAYSVYGGIFPGAARGKNFVALQTKTESTILSIEEAIELLAEMQEGVPQPEELDEFKHATQHAFVFNFESPRGELYRYVSLKLLGYPQDYDSTYIPGIMRLEPHDIKSVAQRRWDLQQLVIMIVGNESLFGELQRLALGKDAESQLSSAQLRPASKLLGTLELKRLQFGEKLIF